MEILRLPADEAAVRRYMEELWIPYVRDLEVTVDSFALADDVDLAEDELEFQLDRLDDDDCRGWVAVDGSHDEENLVASDGEFVGFIITRVDEAPDSFARPDRLIISELYVHEPYRGTGLARELVDRARTRAREAGCRELQLDVDVDNERAIAFYEKLGFEPSRYTMVASVERGDSS